MKLDNVTGLTRWYDDACGTALAMQLIGERWSVLIVRELMYGPRRFSGLRTGLPRISANTLTLRLGTLERAGILGRCTLPSPALVQVYELTPWGYRSEAAIMALGRWEAQGMTISGDRSLADRFASLFELPAKLEHSDSDPPFFRRDLEITNVSDRFGARRIQDRTSTLCRCRA